MMSLAKYIVIGIGMMKMDYSTCIIVQYSINPLPLSLNV